MWATRRAPVISGGHIKNDNESCAKSRTHTRQMHDHSNKRVDPTPTNTLPATKMTTPASSSCGTTHASADAFAMTICCLGAGYVGGSTMAVIASHCPTIKVLVVDTSDAKISQWNSSQEQALPLYEPGLHELLAATRGVNLFFTSDVQSSIQEADMIFVCVDTPTKASGLGAGSASDTRNCEECARAIARFATTDKIVVEKSTVPVRTAASMNEVLHANCSNSIRFEVISNPEFLSEGSALANLHSPNRLLIGGASTPNGAAAVDKLVWIYSHWVPRGTLFLATGTVLPPPIQRH